MEFVINSLLKALDGGLQLIISGNKEDGVSRVAIDWRNDVGSKKLDDIHAIKARCLSEFDNMQMKKDIIYWEETLQRDIDGGIKECILDAIADIIDSLHEQCLQIARYCDRKSEWKIVCFREDKPDCNLQQLLTAFNNTSENFFVCNNKDRAGNTARSFNRKNKNKRGVVYVC